MRNSLSDGAIRSNATFVRSLQRLGHWQLRPSLAKSVATIALTLFGCAERSPQQQMIPAVMDNDVAKVEALLNDKAHVDVNWQAGGDDITALISAAGRNRLEIAQLLLKRGADPNLSTGDGWSPILMATEHGDEEMVRLLLASGANPNTSENRHGFSPLARAASNGYTKIANLLLEAGADPYAKVKDGRDSVDLARHFGHAETLGVLLHAPDRTKTPVE